MSMKNEDLQDDVAAVFGSELRQNPTSVQQSWGAIISIVIIVLMIIMGAYYSYSKRAAEINAYTATTTVEQVIAQ